MREYRATHLLYKDRERKRDNEYKKMKRRTDPEWLARERERRREYGKIERYRNPEKDKILMKENYRKNPKHFLKIKARARLEKAVINREIKRPKNCELCNKKPNILSDKRAKSGYRYPLRGDHYKGYKKENWLIVRWICKDCDGKQLRSKKKLVSP
jgi:hypothetical protein